MNDMRMSQSTLKKRYPQYFHRTCMASQPVFRSNSKDSNDPHHHSHHFQQHLKKSSSKFHRFLNTFRRSSSANVYRLDKNRRIKH
ncbi:unnamed protein product [Didymodactylos carnosus]|uniref:Uncharacterized protein n=1 Tax=Didymodactylos carnosus TaxID=1234261 RepID=A0A814WU49_9BILA|nr:unnamed protein product [Didymodactylos carnosus]CAF1232545.1 unnamed protein product [Didymodactylos carnosus]CAF3974344.1 unnamed protein product [Didymodactylos carnosus]CAF4040651.1 unnamed protein product [Didymodactylos carnosus]